MSEHHRRHHHRNLIGALFSISSRRGEKGLKASRDTNATHEPYRQGPDVRYDQGGER